MLGTTLLEGIALEDGGRTVAAIRLRDRTVVLGEARRPARGGISTWPVIRGMRVFVDGLFPTVPVRAWAAGWYETDLATVSASDEHATSDPASGEPRIVRDALPTADRDLRKGIPKVVFVAVVGTLVPQAIAAFLLAKVGVPGGTLALHVTAAVVTLALATFYGVLIARLPDIARLFAYNAVLLRSIAAHDIGAPTSMADLRRQTSFHPLASGVFLFLLVILMALAATTADPVLSAATLGPFFTHGAAVTFKVALIPLLAGLIHEVQLILARLYRNPLARGPIHVAFFFQRLWVGEPDDAQLELGCVALREFTLRANERN